MLLASAEKNTFLRTAENVFLLTVVTGTFPEKQINALSMKLCRSSRRPAA